jgi:hypothetical protein
MDRKEILSKIKGMYPNFDLILEFSSNEIKKEDLFSILISSSEIPKEYIDYFITLIFDVNVKFKLII